MTLLLQVLRHYCMLQHIPEKADIFAVIAEPKTQLNTSVQPKPTEPIQKLEQFSSQIYLTRWFCRIRRETVQAKEKKKIETKLPCFFFFSPTCISLCLVFRCCSGTSHDLRQKLSEKYDAVLMTLSKLMFVTVFL